MATYLFSQVKGKSIQFDTQADVLYFDFGSAADLTISATLTSVTFKVDRDFVTVTDSSTIGLLALTPKNVVFADGSQLLVGDTTTNILGDLLGNNLKGSNGNDLLIGFTGSDTLDGGEGSDTYQSGWYGYLPRYRNHWHRPDCRRRA
jgi:Ca2+-binding RTX toxin-like protein